MKRVNDLRGQAAVSRTAGAISLSLANGLRARLRYGDKGQSLVEFALVLPALLGVLLAIFELGIFLINYQTLTQSVDQGGVALQEIYSTTFASDPCAAIATAVIGSAGNLQTAGTNGIQLQAQIVNTTTSGTQGTYQSTFQPAATFSCGAGSGYVVQNATATVTGTYPCVPFAVLGIKFFASGCTMKVTSQELIQ
jgi:Flp pilus assembly protein TadG